MSVAAKTQPKLTVLNPEGYPPKVDARGMAPALETLQDKNLFLVDIGFENSNNFIDQLHGWLAEHEPGIRTEVVRWRDQHNPDPELCERIAAEGDAAIIGVGTWPGCAPEVSGHMIDMESRYGIPTVAVHVHVFARLVDSTARTNGMPRARQAFVPAPMFNQPPAVLRRYVEGDDAVHGGPFMRRVFDLLTQPLPDEELRGSGWDRSTPRLVEPDTEENLQQLFRDNHWTDYLPIVLPTEERVEAMLAGTSRAPDEVVGKHRPTIGMELWESTVEKVAVNAVMAGAAPEHFPVILAACASGDTGRQSSMSSMGSMVVVNGPIRDEIGMNSGIGAMGPYNHANSAIGRAFGLASQNLQGGSVPGVSYGGSQGCNLSYNCCTFAENEERSPFPPFHVDRGHEPDDSTVTIFYVWGSVWSEHLREYWPEKLKAMMSGLEPLEGALFVLDPIVAREFCDKGLDSRQKIADWVHENVRIPARRYWDHIMLNMVHELVEGGVEPWASLAKAEPDELIPLFQTFGVNVVVAGGETNGHFSIFQGAQMPPAFRSDPTLPLVAPVDPWR